MIGRLMIGPDMVLKTFKPFRTRDVSLPVKKVLMVIVAGAARKSARLLLTNEA